VKPPLCVSFWNHTITSDILIAHGWNSPDLPITLSSQIGVFARPMPRKRGESR